MKARTAQYNRAMDGLHQVGTNRNIAMQARMEKEAGPGYVTEERAKTVSGQRSGIAKSTDTSLNNADPFGDGDQSAVAAMYGNKGQELKNIWCQGGNFNPRNTELGHFTRSCYLGNVKIVRKLLSMVRGLTPEQRRVPAFMGCVFGSNPPPGVEIEVKEDGGVDWTYALCNWRESTLRVSPLHAAVMGARSLTMPQWKQGMFDEMLDGEAPDHVEVARILLEAGSAVGCRDIAGATCVHHATTNFANEHTLAILPLLVAAGANVNAQDRFGRLALFEPCMGRKRPVVKALLDLGCDPHFVGPEGCSARMLCRAWPEGQKLISEAGLGKGVSVLPLRGQCVRIAGLRGERGDELNGLMGICGALSSGSGRHPVVIECMGRTLGVKPKNLQLMSKLR